ncbi:MAG: hypothetical protein IV086_10480 [Hyphomonadaceae bacterium]|nr:hypothetical protein [Hyphomonadaceae bacterium]
MKIPPPRKTVGELKTIFVMMGCELRELPGLLVDEGGSPRKISYLFNPENGAFVSLSDFSDDEEIPWGVVHGWERRLGIDPIPKGSPN